MQALTKARGTIKSVATHLPTGSPARSTVPIAGRGAGQAAVGGVVQAMRSPWRLATPARRCGGSGGGGGGGGSGIARRSAPSSTPGRGSAWGSGASGSGRSAASAAAAKASIVKRDPALLGLLLGKGGSNFKSLQAANPTCKIQVYTSATRSPVYPPGTVIITGRTPGHVQAAERQIREHVSECMAIHHHQ